MSASLGFEQDGLENKYVQRVSKQVVKGTSVYFLIIGILCTIIIGLVFWGVSEISNDIQQLKDNDVDLKSEINEVKTQIIISNTYLEIIANNAKNTAMPVEENKVETNE